MEIRIYGNMVDCDYYILNKVMITLFNVFMVMSPIFSILI